MFTTSYLIAAHNGVIQDDVMSDGHSGSPAYPLFLAGMTVVILILIGCFVLL
jgi:hypothetical protein